MDDITRRENLQNAVKSAFAAADWLYHDVRLNIDGEALERTKDRLVIMHDQHGKLALFGIAAAWSIKTSWRVQDAFRLRGLPPPKFVPHSLILESLVGEEDKKRACISAHQFFATVTSADWDMGEAIFNVAYESGLEDVFLLMYFVLVISIRISTQVKSASFDGV